MLAWFFISSGANEDNGYSQAFTLPKNKTPVSYTHLKEADKILSQEDYACIPLYYPQSQFIAKPYVKNYKVGNLIYHFWNVDVDTAAQNQ